jgi:hypothetical protein
MSNYIPKKKNTKQFMHSIGWFVIVLPVMGLSNPMWLLNPSFPNKFDNNKEIISAILLRPIMNIIKYKWSN